MAKSTVRRCIRPQCMKIYQSDIRSKYCDCGALLQTAEIELIHKKDNHKKTANSASRNGASAQNAGDEKKSIREEPKEETSGSEMAEKKAYLYLLLDNDEEVEFELGSITRIGRAADLVQVDIDLAQYAGKDVSRKHAVITREKDGYYITNVSQNHSVRIVDQDENETVIEYGKKELLKSEDGILLSRKVLLQFIEEE